MEEQNVSDKSVFKQKVELERKKFWDMGEENKASQAHAEGEDQPQKVIKTKKKSGNIILFIATLAISMAIFAYILFFIVG